MREDNNNLPLGLCGPPVAPILFHIILHLESGFVQPVKLYPDLKGIIYYLHQHNQEQNLAL